MKSAAGVLKADIDYFTYSISFSQDSGENSLNCMHLQVPPSVSIFLSEHFSFSSPYLVLTKEQWATRPTRERQKKKRLQ